MSKTSPKALSSSAARKVGQTCACFNLRKAARRVTQLFDEALRPAGLRATQFTLLTAIHLGGPVSIQELAERLVMERTTLTRNLRILERRELVQIASGTDRRVHEVSLTTAGTQLLARAYPYWQTAQEQVARSVGAERYQQLLSDLRPVIEASVVEIPSIA